MKFILNIKKLINTTVLMVAVFMMSMLTSCDFEFDLPESNSKADETPPSAIFSATVSSTDYLTFSFSNQSNSATDYLWDFGDGNSATSKDGQNTYSGEGSYVVTLTASDKLGASSTYSETIEVVKPPEPPAIVPVIVNADFDKQAKSSGSDCACAGWINKSLGAQGESSSGNGGSDNVLKFDNDEQDLIYQEFALSPNTDYTITYVAGWKAMESGAFPSKLETRILAGAGYESGYTPAYYDTAAEYPQDDFGYTSVAQMEEPANNLMVETVDHPNDTSYNTYIFSFNSGNNTSVALVIRGVGGDGTPSDDKGFLWNNGEEEIRIDSVTVEPVE